MKVTRGLVMNTDTMEAQSVNVYIDKQCAKNGMYAVSIGADGLPIQITVMLSDMLKAVRDG